MAGSRAEPENFQISKVSETPERAHDCRYGMFNSNAPGIVSALLVLISSHLVQQTTEISWTRFSGFHVHTASAQFENIVFCYPIMLEYSEQSTSNPMQWRANGKIVLEVGIGAWENVSTPDIAACFTQE
eukprot:766950-Hanusia_phi.AAC.2